MSDRMERELVEKERQLEEVRERVSSGIENFKAIKAQIEELMSEKERLTSAAKELSARLRELNKSIGNSRPPEGGNRLLERYNDLERTFETTQITKEREDDINRQLKELAHKINPWRKVLQLTDQRNAVRRDLRDHDARLMEIGAKLEKLIDEKNALKEDIEKQKVMRNTLKDEIFVLSHMIRMRHNRKQTPYEVRKNVQDVNERMAEAKEKAQSGKPMSWQELGLLYKDEGQQQQQQ